MQSGFIGSILALEIILITLAIFSSSNSKETYCASEFNGFGIHLGSIQHFNFTNSKVIEAVLDKLYFDLKIRHFRTSFEAYFSSSPDNYNLTCDPLQISNCTWSWETILEILSNRTKYSHAKFIASVWLPPAYLMDSTTLRLRPDKETEYYWYLKNVTRLIKLKYGLRIERISPVNEPENLWAPWQHCNMDPAQLCRLVTNYNDTLISLCPENAYFWMSKLYLQYKNPHAGIDCSQACSTVASHSYVLNADITSPNYGRAYYDLDSYDNPFNADEYHPIWMTEVSSTYVDADSHQMDEAIDLATNIFNFLGITCVQRYYFWSAFTIGPFGESLIWATAPTYELTFPKKYFVYNHFTNGSYFIGPNAKMRFTNVSKDVQYLAFTNPKDIVTVFLNRANETQNITSQRCPCGLCCTTSDHDLTCSPSKGQIVNLPSRSVCSCVTTCQRSQPILHEGRHRRQELGWMREIMAGILTNFRIL